MLTKNPNKTVLRALLNIISLHLLEKYKKADENQRKKLALF